MANKQLFNSKQATHRKVPKANTKNRAGGKAYSRKDEAALAQYSVTGMFTDTFYDTAENQLKQAIAIAAKCDPHFIAQCAIYAREKGYMKDMPAFLCAVLAARDVELLKKVFPRVIDNGKMLRNFVQIIRSGVTGRQSLGNAPKRLIQNWFASRKWHQLFRDSVGNDPSLADVIKLARPRPTNANTDALYGYIIGKDYDEDALPNCVKEYEDYKKNKTGKVPNVPFQMLTALDLGTKEWTQIADNANWQMTRMNLNTFNRHGVFTDDKMVSKIAKRLADPKEVEGARAFPYQLLVAYNNTQNLPQKITNALQDAMEHATKNVPSFEDKVVKVFVDTSYSMQSCRVGNSGAHSSYSRGSAGGISCVDVAALIASCLLRVNTDVEVIPFDTQTHSAKSLNPRDSVMTNTKKLRNFGGGGTDCSAPLREQNKKNAKADIVIYLSDNESWFEGGRRGYGWGSRGTSTAHEWAEFKRRNKGAKCICVDLEASSTVQLKDSDDVMNIGGFSDNIWDIVKMFVAGEYGADAWTKAIKTIDV